MTSAAEKHAKANTLSCVIGLCIGKVTTVELRNESHVTGRVVEVSIYVKSRSDIACSCEIVLGEGEHFGRTIKH